MGARFGSVLADNLDDGAADDDAVGDGGDLFGLLGRIDAEADCAGYVGHAFRHVDDFLQVRRNLAARPRDAQGDTMYKKPWPTAAISLIRSFDVGAIMAMMSTPYRAASPANSPRSSMARRER